MSGSITSLSIGDDRIAVLTFDDPSKRANVLARAVLVEIEQHFDQLEQADVLGLIICSGKQGSFIAGADLREFAQSIDATSEEVAALCGRGRKLFQRLQQFPFVTVAAIEGVCLGGGAELSIWCDHRILATSQATQFGFPEVKLGLFPGWGGTARASRIVGLSNAVELVTSGNSVSAQEAVALGLATDAVAEDRLIEAAKRLVQSEAESQNYLARREQHAGPISMSETELAFLGATASGYIQQQTKGHYPAPLAALEVMLEASQLSVDAACDLEAQGMSQLFGSAVNRALLNVFFLSERNKKDLGVDVELQPEPIESVSVIGAGIMGSGIAAANLKRGLQVTLSDASAEAVQTGLQQVLEEASYNKRTKTTDPQRSLELVGKLRGSQQPAEIAGSDLVIEAIVENQAAKQQLFAELEPSLSAQAVLASNTSTIPITKLAARLARPERLVGVHFFNPVRKMPLVEVIRGEQTSNQTVTNVVAYAKRIGKSPIVVKDGPGFLVNRLLLPYMNEALELVHEGIPLKTIDRTAKAFGMPLGPIALYDMVGLDTSMYAGRVMWEAYPDRIAASPILPVLIKAGRKGQKSGAGFYSYAQHKERGEADPVAEKLLESLILKHENFTAEQLTTRLFLPMVLEATRVLDEKLVRNVRDIDLGMIYGLGFPPFKGGLLFWADTLGAAKLIEMLKPFAYLGERMQPTRLLQEMAARGQKFYDL